MALTPSTMLPLGEKLPRTLLINAIDGKTVDVNALAQGKRGVLVMFICNHCPYVVHLRSELAKVAHEAMAQEFAVVAINSNSVESHPQDGPSHMAALAKQQSWKFPFLFDDTQAVAKAFKAACTPDLFLFDAQETLVYRGQFDDSRPENGKPVTGKDLRAALHAVAAGEKPNAQQKPSMGCNIKWK